MQENKSGCFFSEHSVHCTIYTTEGTDNIDYYCHTWIIRLKTRSSTISKTV